MTQRVIPLDEADLRLLLKAMLVEGNATYQEVADLLGVSRQRIYQLTVKFEIFNNAQEKRAGYWKYQPIKIQWLWRTLRARVPGSKDYWLRYKILEDMRESLPDNCPVFDQPLKYDRFSAGYFDDFSPSLDRINSSVGYEIGNLQVISWKANRIKDNATPEELIKIGNYLITLREQTNAKSISRKNSGA